MNQEDILMEALRDLEAGIPEKRILELHSAQKIELEEMFFIRQLLLTQKDGITPEPLLLSNILGQLPTTGMLDHEHPKNKETTKHNLFLQTISNLIHMSNQGLVGLVVVIVLLIGAVTISSLSKPEGLSSPQANIPADTPANASASDITAELDSMITETEEAIASEDETDGLTLASEDEIINTYGNALNEDEL